LAVYSCKKEEKLPEGIMNEEQMVSMLIDIHIAQAAIQDLHVDKDSGAFLFKVFERESLLKNNAIDSAFYKSYSWYLDHPQQMYEIYTAVVDTLTLRESLLRTSD
jgi:hypothetical protein